MDRFAILKILLEELNLKFIVIRIDGNRHFFIYPEEVIFEPVIAMLGYPPEAVLRKMANCKTVLVAHYDRVKDSPGANDNSVAVFELVKAALTLKRGNIGSWLVIFTDKEELSCGASLKEQGSYSLAKFLKEGILDKTHIFIFDCCGVGDTLIISTAVDHLLQNEDSTGFARSRHLVAQMRERSLVAARNIRLERVLLVPTPFSDDAGFFRAGLAAQTITVLPASEASELASLLRLRPELADALVSEQDGVEKDFIPKTWLSINGPGDRYETLTPRNFQKITDFALALVGVS
ncbi:MAG: Zn-dependent exopeptidase M28 [Treponema sp.]|nr:Zn-dependent exopeptidase M28 [Treponema sp.]